MGASSIEAVSRVEGGGCLSDLSIILLIEFVVFIPFSTYVSTSKNPFMHPVRVREEVKE